MKKPKLILSFIISAIIIIVAIISGKLSTKDSNFVNNVKNIYNSIASTILNENSTINVNNTEIDETLYKVIRVVDGDTIIIDYNGTEERVRLIGIDTPESVHPDKDKNTEFGKIASDYTKSMLENKSVKIELDVQERDQYGRILAYVYLDNIMFNKTLLREGYAKMATYPPNVKYVDDFTKIQEEAKNNKKGLWGLE